MSEQEKKNKRPAKKVVHLFTGFVFCDCDYKMYVPSNSPKYICYKCRNKIGTDDLEEIFHHQLKTFLFSPTEITDYLNRADKVIKEKKELLKDLKEKKLKTEQEMNKIYKAYINDELTMDSFGRHYRPLEERYKQIDNQIPELQGEVDFLKIQYLSRDQIISEAKDLSSRWPQLTPEEKRKIVENITEKIIIGKDNITINLCYLPSSSKLMADGQRNHKESELSVSLFLRELGKRGLIGMR